MQKGVVNLETLLLVVNFQLLERELARGRRGDVAQRITHPTGIELIDHDQGHRLHPTAHANIATGGRLAVTFEIVGLFGAACHHHMDDGFAVVLFGINIVESKACGQDVVLDTVGDREHQRIGILDAHHLPIIIHPDVEIAALSRIEEGHHLLLQRIAGLHLEFGSVIFNAELTHTSTPPTAF